MVYAAGSIEEQIRQVGERIRALSEQQRAFHDRAAAARGLPTSAEASPACLASRLSRLSSEARNAQRRNTALETFCGEWKSWVRENFKEGSCMLESRRKSYLEAAESMLPFWGEVTNRETSAAVAGTRVQLEALMHRKQEVFRHLEERKRVEEELRRVQSELQAQQSELPSLYHALAQDVMRPRQAEPWPPPVLARQPVLSVAAEAPPSEPRLPWPGLAAGALGAPWGGPPSPGPAAAAGPALPWGAPAAAASSPARSPGPYWPQGPVPGTWPLGVPWQGVPPGAAWPSDPGCWPPNLPGAGPWAAQAPGAVPAQARAEINPGPGCLSTLAPPVHQVPTTEVPQPHSIGLAPRDAVAEGASFVTPCPQVPVCSTVTGQAWSAPLSTLQQASAPLQAAATGFVQPAAALVQEVLPQNPPAERAQLAGTATVHQEMAPTRTSGMAGMVLQYRTCDPMPSSSSLSPNSAAVGLPAPAAMTTAPVPCAVEDTHAAEVPSSIQPSGVVAGSAGSKMAGSGGSDRFNEAVRTSMHTQPVGDACAAQFLSTAALSSQHQSTGLHVATMPTDAVATVPVLAQPTEGAAVATPSLVQATESVGEERPRRKAPAALDDIQTYQAVADLAAPTEESTVPVAAEPPVDIPRTTTGSLGGSVPKAADPAHLDHQLDQLLGLIHGHPCDPVQIRQMQRGIAEPSSWFQEITRWLDAGQGTARPPKLTEVHFLTAALQILSSYMRLPEAADARTELLRIIPAKVVGDGAMETLSGLVSSSRKLLPWQRIMAYVASLQDLVLSPALHDLCGVIAESVLPQPAVGIEQTKHLADFLAGQFRGKQALPTHADQHSEPMDTAMASSTSVAPLVGIGAAGSTRNSLSEQEELPSANGPASAANIADNVPADLPARKAEAQPESMPAEDRAPHEDAETAGAGVLPVDTHEDPVPINETGAQLRHTSGVPADSDAGTPPTEIHEPVGVKEQAMAGGLKGQAAGQGHRAMEEEDSDSDMVLPVRRPTPVAAKRHARAALASRSTDSDSDTSVTPASGVGRQGAVEQPASATPTAGSTASRGHRVVEENEDSSSDVLLPRARRPISSGSAEQPAAAGLKGPVVGARGRRAVEEDDDSDSDAQVSRRRPSDQPPSTPSGIAKAKAAPGGSAYKQRQQAASAPVVSAYKLRQQESNGNGNRVSPSAAAKSKPGLGSGALLSQMIRGNPAWGTAATAESDDEIADLDGF